MRISFDDADALVEGAMITAGFDADEARIITDQIMGCELRGVSFAGLSRALSLVERLQSGPAPSPMTITRETEHSALIDGGNSCGYLVAHRAVQIAMEKAENSGVGIVGANNTYYSGMYAHYMEIATRRDLVAMAAGSSAPRVAPFGATDGRFGTNPIAFGFPSNGDPIIFDTGTSGIPIAEVVLCQRKGIELQPGFAFDAEGNETTDPFAALQGALTVWGGHRGSGLAIVVQLLGILVGGGMMPDDYQDCGFFFLALRPDLFGGTAQFKQRASEYAEMVRQARPIDASTPIRMPYDRSAEARRRIQAQGYIDAPESVLDALRAVRRG